MIRVAIPNKGVLCEPSKRLLERLGFSFSGRKLFSYAGNYEAALVRAQDVPVVLEEGAAQLGITGYDVARESGVRLRSLLDLGFGKCRLVLAGQIGSSLAGIGQKPRVATSFPNLARKYFRQKGIEARIVRVSGAVENTIRLGMADYIVDLTSSGRTLMENRLVVLDTLLESSARLVSRGNGKEASAFARKLEGLL
ncbi:MAG: ATP phosphoribosyltransferase [archaeon]